MLLSFSSQSSVIILVLALNVYTISHSVSMSTENANGHGRGLQVNSDHHKVSPHLCIETASFYCSLISFRQEQQKFKCDNLWPVKDHASAKLHLQLSARWWMHWLKKGLKSILVSQKWWLFSWGVMGWDWRSFDKPYHSVQSVGLPINVMYVLFIPRVRKNQVFSCRKPEISERKGK